MRRSKAASAQRGAVAVFVAVVLVVIGAFLALGMNIGHSRMVRGQLQNAADAAALAGAKDLDGTLATIQSGIPNASAEKFASRHVSDRAVTVSINADEDVVLGHWDPFSTNPATAFTELTASTEAEAREVNAVLVKTGRETSRASAVQVWFSQFLGGQRTSEVRAEAIAVNGGPCTQKCPSAPLAFFSCGILDPTTYELECGNHPHMTATLTPDPSDTVGLTNLTTSAGVDGMRTILGGSCVPVEVEDDIMVQNGGAGLTSLCDSTGKPEETFNKFCQADAAGVCTEPQVLMAPIVSGDCVASKFNQIHTIVGFASFKIVRLICGGHIGYMEFEFMCNQARPADVVGCGFFGTSPLELKLVR